MGSCAKPVSEQTAGEIASCAGAALKHAACLLVFLLPIGAVFRRG
jgi:hypothetical protein